LGVTLWSVHGDGRRVRDGEFVRADERMSWPLTIGLGVQHVAAMVGATVLVPALTGFPAGTTLLFCGIGTLLFLAITRNRVPAFLGSSYAFVAPLAAAREEGAAAQLGAVLLAGAVLVVVGVAVKALGVRLVESVMPPLVAGAVVLIVVLGLAPQPAAAFSKQPVIGALTVTVIAICAVGTRGLLARLSVLIGVVVGWLAAAAGGVLADDRVDDLVAAAWVGLPQLHAPQLRPSVVGLVVPVVIVLVAETVGHMKAIATVTGRTLDGAVGDALIANGAATTLAGLGGGSGTTTYAENIGLMGVTRVFSTAAYAIAAVLTVLLSCSPKATALIATVPDGVVGGSALVLFGMVALTGVRIWQQAGVDLVDPVNAIVVGVALLAGVGGVTITIGGATLGGIAWGSLAVVLGYPLLRRVRAMRRTKPGPP
jgi:uracil-xanthine permease